MFASAEKTLKPAAQLQRRQDSAPFFAAKAGEQVTASGSFFAPTAVQPKLTVSTPGDTHEREADAMADSVMRMPAPPQRAAPLSGHASVEAPGIDRAAQDHDDDHDTAYPLPVVQRLQDREEEEPLQTKRSNLVQRETGKEEEEEPVQAKHSTALQRQGEQEEEEEVQAKRCDVLKRSGPEVMDEKEKEGSNIGVQPYRPGINRGMHASDIILRSGRGPPRVRDTFEHTLHGTSASGDALPDHTRSFMEQRFGADFSGVRVHTDTRAQEMNRDIHAHAFTWGNHIYFNSGRYDTESHAGKTLLAHELTHTIQQGASPAYPSSVQRYTPVRGATLVHRQAVVPQLDHAVTLAQGEQGKVIANKEGPDGYRVGWERLLEYFKTTFGEDKIVSNASGVRGTVWEQHIKKKSEVMGQIPNQSDPNEKELRDAMPSWCGIFVFWSLNKSGVPMPKWRLGEPMFPPESAYPPGYLPKPGDIAYRQKRSHYGIVVKSEGGMITSVNGNTAGTDNLGGEVQEQTHSPDQWDGFFNPLAVMEGNLRDPAHGDADTEPRSLRELRKEKFGAQRKHSDEEQIEENGPDVDAKHDLSVWSVTESGDLQRTRDSGESEKKEEDEEMQRFAGASVHENAFASDAEEDDHAPANAPDAVALPLQRSSLTPTAGRAVQASWLGDAWDAVSNVVSEAAEFIEQGIDAAKEWLLEKVRDFVIGIPGYTLLRIILEYDPITGERVTRTGDTVLSAVLDLLPVGGELVRSVLDYFNATVPVSTWLLGSIVSLVTLIESVAGRFERFWDGLSIDDVGDPDGVITRIADLFKGVVTDVVDFAVDCGETFLTMVKDIAIVNVTSFVRNHFPNAFELLCVVLGENPITGETVPLTGANILNAGLAVLGERGAQIKGQMLENGIFQRCAAWIDRAISVVTDTVSDIGNAFTEIWDELSFESLFHPIDTFLMIAGKFERPVTRVVDFITDAMLELLKILKEVLLDKLSKFASETRGYFLICVILGKDVFTGKTVPRNAENLIRGFMSLMDGGEEQFRQLKESGAIDRTTQKIMAAIKRLNFTWAYITGLFTELWNSLDWTAFLNPLAAFARIVATFAQPVRRLVAFIIEIVKIVVEVLLVVMSFPIDVVNQLIARVLTVFDSIKRDPIGFLKNLLKAIKQGFIQFFDNILKHLLSGLADWFFHQLGDLGIQKPPDLSFKSILNLIMQILGISLRQIMDKVWKKLAEKIGQDKVDRIKGMIDKLEGVWKFIRDVMERGPIAIWEYIQEKLSNLWTIVLDAAKNWIMTKIIEAVVTKLLSMLDPTGIMAVINSVIAIYRAIQSFIEYIREMLNILNSFVQGVAEIATGNIKVAADFLERTMARAIPIIIGFLANQVGLGKIGQKIAEIIGAIREKVDAAVDWLIDKAIAAGGKLLEMLKTAGQKVVAAFRKWLGLEKRFAANGEQHRLYFTGSEENAVLTVASNPTPYSSFIESVKVDEKKEKEKATAKKEALAIAAAIDKKRREKLEGDTDEKKEESKKKKIEEVEKLLEQLAPITVTLFGSTAEVDKSEIKHTPDSAGPTTFGTFARGYKLAKGKFEQGSTPTAAKHNIYDVLDQRRMAGGASYYVRGHLLNEHLGGKGVWNNLTPLSRDGNHKHEEQVESLTKAAVDSGAIVEYTIAPQYAARPDAASLKKDIDAANDPDAATKKAIIDAEDSVPHSMLCASYILEKKGNEFVRKQPIAEKDVPNPISRTVKDYDLAGGQKPPVVYLEDALKDPSIVLNLGEVDAVTAQAIVDAYKAKKTRFVSWEALANAAFGGDEPIPANLDEARKKEAEEEAKVRKEARTRLEAVKNNARIKLYRVGAGEAA
ncbi:MAG: DUF4157 domain-containing protein [Bacteroidia bacterium]|nr:DUF4157 domain-containing protein [Bacteroidia bacterium]